MNRSKLLLVPALIASTALVAAPAEAATTHVTPKVWHVYTSPPSGQHNVALGGTFSTCVAVDEIYLKTRVTHAHKGGAFKETWSFNGVNQETDTFAWDKSGAFTDYFGWTPQGGNIPDGTWKVRVFKAGKTLAQGRVTLQGGNNC